MGTVTNRRISLGRHGEQLAVEFLMAKGYQILDRNWYCGDGELDIVAQEVADDGSSVVVFCEVKCRRGLRFGHPLETITTKKVRRLRQLAALWMRAHDVHADYLRLDAIGVLLTADRPAECDHVVGIDQ